jgi:hypothetical protein
MATSEWQDLLARSGVQDASPSNVIQQLTAMAGVSGGSGGSIGVSSIGGPPTNASNAQGGSDGSSQTLSEQMTSLVMQITALNTAQQTQVNAIQDNTQAVTQNTATKGTTGSSVGSTIGGIASSVLGGGLSLSPLVSGLMSLFGGGSQQVSAPTPFTLPAPVQYQAGLTGGASGQIGPVSYGQTGQARPENQNSSPQVTIQVNAMDSQSFLDHSDDIANAVKAAILNSNSLNDVILGM